MLILIWLSNGGILRLSQNHFLYLHDRKFLIIPKPLTWLLSCETFNWEDFDIQV